MSAKEQELLGRLCEALDSPFDGKIDMAMTLDGQQYFVHWAKGNAPRTRLVWGHSREEALRKAIQLEEELATDGD